MSPRTELFITNVDYKRKDPVFWIEVQGTKSRRIPRYYSELEKLHQYLVHMLDDVLVPVLPACPLARFDKRTGQLLGRQWWLSHPPSNDNRLEYKIQIWLDRIVKNERVQRSEGLREFVESEVGFRPNKTTTAAAEATTKAPFLAGHVVIHATEADMEPEFGQCSRKLNTFHQNSSQLATQLNKLQQEQKDLAQACLKLSSAWVSYGGLERNSHLFILYKSIAKGYQQLHDLNKFQELAMSETLGEEINYQIKNCESTQNAMQRRLNALSAYLTSRKYTESSLRSVERLKTSLHIDRDQATEAIAILEDARIHEKNNLNRFQRIDMNLRNDIENHYKPNRSQDLLNSLKMYAKSQLYLEKKKLLVLEHIMHT